MAETVIKINTTANPAFLRVPPGGATVYATSAAFPSASDNVGQFAIDEAAALLYIAFNGSWWPIVALQ